MNKTIGLLAVLGVAAALCAAVLVTSLRTGGPTTSSTESKQAEEVVVLTAHRDMEAMTVLQADDIHAQRIRAEQTPPNHLSHTIEAVGKVLAVPVRKGQALTGKLFVSEGTGVHLASTLEAGMRAMSVSLADYSGLDGLLYPGAIVDVLATFRPKGENTGQADPVSTSLLRGVMVLAVGNLSVVAEEESMATLGTLKRGRRRMVTLCVNPKQAEILQLAAEHGTVSLAMRNPTDSIAVKGGLTQMDELYDKDAHPVEELAAMFTPKALAAQPKPPAEGTDTDKPTPVWNVTVLRAGSAELRQFEAEMSGTASR